MVLFTLFTTLWYFIVNKTISTQYHLEYDKEPFVWSIARKYSDNSTLIVDNHKQKANLCMNAPSICSKCHHTNTLIIINNCSKLSHHSSFIHSSICHSPIQSIHLPFLLPFLIHMHPQYLVKISCVYWLNPSNYLQTTIMTSLLACSKSIILSSLTHPDYYQLGSPSGNLIARCCWVFLPGKPNSFPPTWTKLSFALNAVSITCSIEINIIFLIVCLCLYVCISITIYPSPYIHHHIFIIIYSSPYIHHHIFITIHPSIHNHSKHIEWESPLIHSHCKTHTFHSAKHTHSKIPFPLKTHCKTHTFHSHC